MSSCHFDQFNAPLLISEESFDTEDWSNDAENSALHHRNKLHFKIYKNEKKSYLKL